MSTTNQQKYFPLKPSGNTGSQGRPITIDQVKSIGSTDEDYTEVHIIDSHAFIPQLIYLFAYNTHTRPLILEIRIGGTNYNDATISVSIPAKGVPPDKALTGV